MEETNVNNLNSIPNFGHGMPEDGIVQAGVTDTAVALPEQEMEQEMAHEETNEIPQEDVQGNEGQAQEDTSVERSDESHGFGV